MKEKTADEMFEELGYEKEDGFEGFGLNYIKYTKKVWKDEYQDIVFDLEHNLLNTTREDRQFYRTVASILSMQELQAINKKAKELGWYE